MKKVRIMLMAICLVAVTGGLVAFKTMQPEPYCTTLATTNVDGAWTCTFENAPLICDDYSLTYTELIPPIVSPEDKIICSTPTIDDGCPANRACAEVPVLETVE